MTDTYAADLSTKVTTLSTEIDGHMAAVTQLTSQIQTYEAAIPPLMAEIDTHKAAVPALTDQITILNLRLARTKLRVNVDKPGSDNTGCIKGIPMTNWNDPGTTGKVAVPPGEYWDMHFYGDCYPGDPTGEYVFRNPHFHGGKGHPSNNLGCLYTWNLTTGWVTVEDGTVKADDPSYYRDGIVGHRLTVRRCNIYGTNDGIGINKVNTTQPNILEQNWIHDQIGFRQDPAHSDWTHNDPMQLQCGNNQVRGNTLQAYVTADPRSTGPVLYPVAGRPGVGYGGSAIMISEGGGTFDPNSLIDGNWLEGGYAQVNVNNNRGAGHTLKFKMGINRYGRDVRENYAPRTDKRWIALAPNGGNIVIEGLLTKQTWNDGGGLLTEGRATGIRWL